MANTDIINKWNAAIGKLERLTLEGKLKWRPVAPRDICGRQDDIFAPGFAARVSDKQVLVFPYQFRYYTEDDEWFWQNDVAIEFVKDDLSAEYRWPKTDRGVRVGLIDAIRREVARADDFLDAFLDEQPEHA